LQLDRGLDMSPNLKVTDFTTVLLGVGSVWNTPSFLGFSLQPTSGAFATYSKCS